jgi:hypothetical protein
MGTLDPPIFGSPRDIIRPPVYWVRDIGLLLVLWLITRVT